MTTKTHATAVVLIPSDEVWAPIQAIRRRHDRNVRRWMPHITLLYPFAPRAAFAELAPVLEAACANVAPFRITLARFGLFSHGRRGATIYLAPEPAEPLVALQAMRAIEHLQLDPLQIIARSHNIMLHSRVLEYRPGQWEELAYQQRRFFDWGGWLAARPMDELPHWRVMPPSTTTERACPRHFLRARPHCATVARPVAIHAARSALPLRRATAAASPQA